MTRQEVEKPHVQRFIDQAAHIFSTNSNQTPQNSKTNSFLAFPSHLLEETPALSSSLTSSIILRPLSLVFAPTSVASSATTSTPIPVLIRYSHRQRQGIPMIRPEFLMQNRCRPALPVSIPVVVEPIIAVWLTRSGDIDGWPWCFISNCASP
jgi:hypothetical protein